MQPENLSEFITQFREGGIPFQPLFDDYFVVTVERGSKWLCLSDGFDLVFLRPWLPIKHPRMQFMLDAKSELLALPRRPAIAFLARWARRLYPLYDAWPGRKHPEYSYLDSVHEAIEYAEDYAAGRPMDDEHLNAAVSNREESDASGEMVEAYGSVLGEDDIHNDIAYAAYSAGRALTFLYYADAARAFDGAAGGMRESDEMGSTLLETSPETQGFMLAAFRRDLEAVQRASAERAWTDESPVAPEFFGPMWPDGEPAEWQRRVSRVGDLERRYRAELRKM